MPTIESARELLAASYVFSAKRIQQALQGGLAIANSREPGGPPPSSGEVIGLCGQGGRHPYFKIPLGVLESAVKRIIRMESNLALGRPDVERTLDEIAAACQELRQQTFFDDGTGCVNDRLPSMVPLLPPEEIWFNGRELPLDVWRLVSFEFDLVSSGVASQVPVEDFAFSAVNQSALAFRFLIGQLGNRRTRFEVGLNNIPPAWLPASTAPLSIDVSVARLFFEAGCLLTPLANEEFIKWYAAIRYLHWIDNAATELRVKKEFKADSVDCRYRGLFAEETAVGLMAVVLSEVFGANLINNTVEVAAPGSLKPNRPIADFVAQAINPATARPTTIIAESKGSLGKEVSKARRDRAKVQVAATRVVYAGYPAILPVTFASSVLFSSQPGTTRCLVADPPIDSEADMVQVDTVQAWRVAYSKALKFVGLETAARQVLSGEPAESIRPMDFDRQREKKRSERDFQRDRRAGVARERFGMDLLLDVGPCAVTLDPEVANVLRHGVHKESDHKLTELLRSRRKLARERSRKSSFETCLGLGCVFYADLDEHNEGA